MGDGDLFSIMYVIVDLRLAQINQWFKSMNTLGIAHLICNQANKNNNGLLWFDRNLNLLELHVPEGMETNIGNNQPCIHANC
jgi:hypothetical protein